MSEYGTTTPAAGWYPDPANATLERWWGGVEWTDTTRPIPVVQAAPAPALAGVPGGGINPFAGEVQAETSRLATYDPASAFSTPPSRSFGASSTQPQVSQSWYSTPSAANLPEPTNGVATAGLILSLLGISAIGIICSAIGLSKARDFDRRGQLPVGRKRSRWGLGLGIANIVLLTASTVLYVLFFPQILAWATNYAIENSGLSAPDPTDGSSEFIDASDATGGNAAVAATYDRATVETFLSDDYLQTSGARPDSVVCPDTISAGKGTSFTCVLTAQGVANEFKWVFIDDAGTTEQYVNGVLFEQ